MVGSNDNDDRTRADGTEGTAPRRRKSIFGVRRARSAAPAAGAPAVAEIPEEPSTGAAEPGADAPDGSAAPTRPDGSADAARADAGDERATAEHAGNEDADVAVEGDEPAGPGPVRTADAASGVTPAAARPTTSLIFQAPDLPVYVPRDGDEEPDDEAPSVRRRTRRRADDEPRDGGTAPDAVVKVRSPRPAPEPITEPQRLKGSTRLEAKKQRRRDGRDAGRRRTVVTEAEFLARRESVDRTMVVRSRDGRIQIGVIEDDVLVEHYVAQSQEASLIGNVYLGRVQNVLPSMEAAFVDIGRGRNAVLYSGEVDWDAAAEAGEGKSQARRIELALKPGDRVLVQVTKDPVGHKGARLTSQVSLPGRYLVYVPNGSMSGISRKLPDTERARLKKILKEVLPDGVGVIVRTAAEGATDEQLTLDVSRLTSQWARISEAVEKAQAPAMLHSEPDLLVKIVRDVFNEDFQKLVIDGDDAAETITSYLSQVAPDLIDRVERYEGERDSFDAFRISEQIEKALDRKVWLPSGGSLVIDRTEAMTVVDVNTGKFVGSGGNLEETVTKNNLEAAEEIVRQLRLRDIGGIIVVDFIDMVLESNRDLVLRRLVECLSRDRTKHQVAEVTSLGLVQMTRKKLGLGLLESFSEPCETCAGRGVIVHHDPVLHRRSGGQSESGGRRSRRNGGGNGGGGTGGGNGNGKPAGVTHAITDDVRNALAQIAGSTIAGSTGPAEPTDRADSAPVAADAVRNDAEPASPGGDAVTTDDAPAPRRSRSRGRGGRNRGEQPSDPRGAESAPADGTAGTAPGGPGQDAVVQDAASEGATRPDAGRGDTAAAGDVLPAAAPPVRRISPEDAEQILDSVLDALPAPPAAGRGRARTSRRASSSGTVTVPPADGDA